MANLKGQVITGNSGVTRIAGACASDKRLCAQIDSLSALAAGPSASVIRARSRAESFRYVFRRSTSL